jgi:heterotetrameric sarcosine oxidase delta subunit
MRIPCPHCGERDVQEFAYLGDAGPRRPDGLSAQIEATHDYVYLRDNPAGPHRELWQHVAGCRAWLVVTRDTRTHAIAGAVPARQTDHG